MQRSQMIHKDIEQQCTIDEYKHWTLSRWQGTTEIKCNDQVDYLSYWMSKVVYVSDRLANKKYSLCNEEDGLGSIFLIALYISVIC